TTELMAQLDRVPEVLLEHSPGWMASELAGHAKETRDQWPKLVPDKLTRRGDLSGLPFRRGEECQLFEHLAKSLETLSKKLHDYLDEADRAPGGRDGPAGVALVGARMAQDGDAVWRTPEAIPSLLQVLQVEAVPYRMMIVQAAAGVRGEGAT